MKISTIFAVAFILTFLAFAPPAGAQGATGSEDKSSDVLDEVLVTATRRADKKEPQQRD